jgi:nucleobase transporter 1/2
LHGLLQSTGGFYALAWLAGATLPSPSVISQGIGWQGISLFLNGIFGTFTSATVAL